MVIIDRFLIKRLRSLNTGKTLQTWPTSPVLTSISPYTFMDHLLPKQAEFSKQWMTFLFDLSKVQRLYITHRILFTLWIFIIILKINPKCQCLWKRQWSKTTALLAIKTEPSIIWKNPIILFCTITSMTYNGLPIVPNVNKPCDATLDISTIHVVQGRPLSQYPRG